MWADLSLQAGASVDVAITDADVLVDSNDTVPRPYKPPLRPLKRAP